MLLVVSSTAVSLVCHDLIWSKIAALLLLLLLSPGELAKGWGTEDGGLFLNEEVRTAAVTAGVVAVTSV